jgi:hypothetical protein
LLGKKVSNYLYSVPTLDTVVLKPFQRIIAIDKEPNISAIEKQPRSRNTS